MRRMIKLIKKLSKSKSFDKFLAFLFSFVLWFYVVSGKSVVSSRDIYIDYILPAKLTFVDSPFQKISAQYKGPRALWGSIDNVKMKIDLSKLRRRSKNRQRANDSLSFVKTIYTH